MINEILKERVGKFFDYAANYTKEINETRRSKLGAHYSDYELVSSIVEQVVMRPLNYEWEQIKADFSDSKYKAFLNKLSQFKVLDPACGSGNFLQVALIYLLSFEDKIKQESGVPVKKQYVTCANVIGMDVNYKSSLMAKKFIAGCYEWYFRFFKNRKVKVDLSTIQVHCKDALIDSHGVESQWPEATVVIGNPPFLGGGKFMSVLGEEYTNKLRYCYKDRLKGLSDLVCYFFEKMQSLISQGKLLCGGLVSTNSIRNGDSRKVLDRYSSSLDIYYAISDAEWVSTDASVRISVVCLCRKV